MPYVLLRIGRKAAGLKEVVFTEKDIQNWRMRSSKREQLTFINTTTRRIRKVRGIKP